MPSKTQAMIGPNGKVYDIPTEIVRQASRDGFRFHTEAPSRPVPQELRGMQEHPYMDALEATRASIRGGITAGAMHTAVTSDNLMRRGLNAVGFNYPTAEQNFGISPAAMAPTKDELPAYMAEQAGEFLLPENAMGKFGQASKLGRAGRAALTTGITSLAQTGSGSQAARMAALAGVANPVIEGIGNVAKSAGGYLLNNAMEMSKSVLARSSPGQYAIENGVFTKGWNPFGWSLTKDAMREAGSQMAGQAMDARDAIAATSPQRLTLAPVKQIASETAEKAAADNNETLMGEAGNLYDALAHQKINVTNDPTGAFTKALQKRFPDAELQEVAGRRFLTIPRVSDAVTVTDAINARQGLGAAAPWNTNNFFTPRGTALRNQMYGALNEQIHAVPGIEPLDEMYNAMRPFGKSIDNKPSLWPTMVAAGAGGAGAGPVGALKSAGAYLAARSAGGGYAIGRLGVATPALGRGLLNLGMAASDNASQMPETNPFLHSADRSMIPTK